MVANRDAIKHTTAGDAFAFRAAAALDLGLPLGDFGAFGDLDLGLIRLLIWLELLSLAYEASLHA